jgi:D-xylose transport system substrate-binding protein
VACALLALSVASDAAPSRSARDRSASPGRTSRRSAGEVDEASLVAALRERGARYVSADAQSSAEKQLADVENLITRGANVLVVVAHDPSALAPALARCARRAHPVIAYDRLIEAPDVFYLSFDNRRVGRIQAEQLLAVAPRGRYAFIKGAPEDPNTEFVHAGQLDVLRPAIEAGRVQVVGDQYVDGWLPEVAQRVMEQILTRSGGRIDAVVCSNDGMAGGVAAALAAAGLPGVPVSGQDGDRAALNRIALGRQTVSVWKDSRALGRAAGEVSVALARGTRPEQIAGASSFTTPRGLRVSALLLEPVPITRDNLDRVIEAGWATPPIGVPRRRPRARRRLPRAAAGSDRPGPGALARARVLVAIAVLWPRARGALRRQVPGAAQPR